MYVGGYTTGPKELVALLRQRSRPYLFSNSLPPSVVAQALKVAHALCILVLCVFVICTTCWLQAIELIAESSDLVAKLQENTMHFRTRMTEAGFQLMVRMILCMTCMYVVT